MTTLTIEIPDKYKELITDNTQKRKITSYFIDEYLIELYQDSKTKIELENSNYDKELNSKIKNTLGIL